MNDDEYRYLTERVAAQLARDWDRSVSSILGAILIDFAVIPKRSLYPALAELLGVECECRGLECRGCDDVEEWLMSLRDPEEMLARIVRANDADWPGSGGTG